MQLLLEGTLLSGWVARESGEWRSVARGKSHARMAGLAAFKHQHCQRQIYVNVHVEARTPQCSSQAFQQAPTSPPPPQQPQQAHLAPTPLARLPLRDRLHQLGLRHLAQFRERLEQADQARAVPSRLAERVSQRQRNVEGESAQAAGDRVGGVA